MNTISKYFYQTLIIIQGLFIFLWFTKFNLLGFISWVGKGGNFSVIKFFLPLIIYGGIKILYWFAEPLSELLNIIIGWIIAIGMVYFVYWLFFI